jgi:hypothetical protein
VDNSSEPHAATAQQAGQTQLLASTATVDPFTYVYLASVAHSGSTLLAFLLGAHPEISTVGEFGMPFSGRCSCGVDLLQCPLWVGWAERARAEGLEFTIGNLGINLEPRPNGGLLERVFYHQFRWRLLNQARNLFFPPVSGLRRRAGQALDRSVRLAHLLCRMQGTLVFFDTTKNFMQVRFLASHPPIRLKVISLIRDGRGVMNSLMEKEKHTQERAVTAWLWGNRNIEQVVREHCRPENVFRLRLEDLRANGQNHWHRAGRR